ncbi:restriction endonuclease subunit S [Rhodococcus sp. MALMAid1271]|uniref:restriction endonuclease subunit S n=1 Tax=Rhodococcus sp. MALMAid1271 TaxID=3411744 RepID=UPI003BA126BF
MSWAEVSLGEICEFKYGKSLPANQRDGGAFPVYGSNGVVGYHSATISKGPTIVIGRKGSFGEVAYSSDSCWPIDTTYYVNSPSSDVSLKWLSYRLRGLGLTQMNRAAAVPGLNREDAYRQKLLLPPLEEQRRIAAILDQADALRKKRRQVIVQLDGLAQAIYRDMFRDGEWPQKPIELLGKISTGKTPPTLEPGMFDGPIPFVTPGDLNSRREVARTVSSAGAQASRVVRKGATLVCCIGATIGKVDQARSACAFNQQINAVEWFDEIDDAYGLESMRKLKPVIVAAGASTTMPLLPKSRFGKLSIAVAPVSLQKLFALRTAHLTAQRAVVQHALDLDDQLFSSIQARAFQGEL